MQRVDLLSDIASRIRGGHAFACQIGEPGPWRQRFPSKTGIGFHVIQHGTVWLTSAEKPPEPTAAGDVIFLPTGAEHALHGEDVTLLSGCYHLADPQVHAALRRLPPVSVVTGGLPRLAELSTLLSDDLAADRPGADANRAALVGLVVVQVLRHAETAGAWAVPDPVIAAAVRSLHDDPRAPWTVQLLSSQAGMSRTAFTRRFTILVGKPPMAYVRDVRLSTAARMLRETDAPLTAIARQSGYANEFSFATAFRREYGISPGRFRTGPHHGPSVPDLQHAATRQRGPRHAEDHKAR